MIVDEQVVEALARLVIPDNFKQWVEKANQNQVEHAEANKALRLVAYDDLMEVGDLLKNFRGYWEKSATLDNPDEARKQLLTKIVDRVFVYMAILVSF